MSTYSIPQGSRGCWVRRGNEVTLLSDPAPARLPGGPRAEMESEMEAGPQGPQPYVRWVQQALNRVMGLDLAISGVPDAPTRDAIRRFQQGYGLPVDGMVGPQTEKALLAAGAPPLPWAAGAAGTAAGTDDVLWVQHALNQLLGARLPTDGVMGGQTRDALRAFQQRQGIAATGSLDEQTSLRLVNALGGAPPKNPCAGLKPIEVLDRFDYDRQWVPDAHQGKIIQIARCIVARRNTPNPITRVDVVGHTDAEGTPAYNEQLGMRRAVETARVLRVTLERILPGSSAGVTIRPDTRGEREPTAFVDAARNRRVQIVLPLKPPAPVLPPLPRTVHRVKVVAKSFVAPIGSRVGAPTCSHVMPHAGPPPRLLDAAQRLRQLAAAFDKGFSESARTDAKDGKYRLYSECTFTVICENERVVSVVPDPIITDAGEECVPLVGLPPCRQPPSPEVVSPVTVASAGPAAVAFTWMVRGRPNNLLEAGLQFGCPRACRFIWHEVDGIIDCSRGAKLVRLTVWGSRFPSHRVFVDGIAARLNPQGEMRNLWIPNASDPSLVA